MANEFHPYVGPRPFEREDSRHFFGRERESSELLSRVVAHPALLLYSQSGAGKTSLLNASLIPMLEKEGFEVLPTARVRGLDTRNVAADDIPNVYAFNVLLSWNRGSNQQDLAQMRLADFLKSSSRQTSKEGPAPRIAVFDQFEELFTFYPERWSDREDFFDQVGEALEADRMMRVIFVMREDYIAELDPYVLVLPEKLRTRFRLERLREESALEAVKAPLTGTGYSFAEGNGNLGVAEQLVNNLLKVPVETVSGVATVVGEFVEPVQLQVVCQNLWQKLDHASPRVITHEQLQAFGDVDEALSDFYEDAIANVANLPGVNEGQLRRWFEHTLITPSGTRGTVYRSKDETGGIPNAAVDKLVDHHVIRGELRGGARWYELTHDRLIKPIVDSNNQWMMQRSGAQQTRQLLEARAAEWVRRGRPASGLLDEAELLEATRWLESPSAADVGFSDALVALVQTSRARAEEAAHERERALFVEQQKRLEAEHAQVEEQQRRMEEQAKAARRMRLLAAALAVMFLMSVGFGVYGFNKSRSAQLSAKNAIDAGKLANDEKANAEAQTVAAKEAEKHAEESAAVAKRAKEDAEKAGKAEAEARKKAEANAKAKMDLARLEAREAAHEKVDTLVNSAYTLYGTNNLSGSAGKYEDAAEEYRKIGDREREADMRVNLASVSIQQARDAYGKDRQDKYAKAVEELNKALELKRATSGPESNDVATVLNYLGVISYDQHSYDEALKHYNDALDIRKKANANGSELALSYSNLGGTYSQMDRYPEAQSAYEQALAIRSKGLETDDPTLVQSHNRVAGVESSRGHSRTAEIILKNSLESLSKASPSNTIDLDRAGTLNQLGVSYFYQGRYADAVTQYLAALALNRQLRGLGSSQERTNLYNLALAKLALADYAAAEAFVIEALSFSINDTDNDENVALAFSVVARIRREQGNSGEAEAYFNQALDKMIQAKGPEHSRVGTIEHYMAQFYAAQGQYDRAEKFETDALAIYRNRLEPQHWYISRSLGTLAAIYAGQGKNAEAEKTYKLSLQGLESQVGLVHPEVAYSLNGLANLYITLRRYGEAEPLLKRALNIRESLLGAEHPSVADTLQQYTVMLRATGRETEAAPLDARVKFIRAKFPQPCRSN